MKRLKVIFGSIIYVLGLFYSLAFLMGMNDVAMLMGKEQRTLVIFLMVMAFLFTGIQTFIFFCWGRKFIREGRGKNLKPSVRMQKIKKVVGYLSFLYAVFYMFSIVGSINTLRHAAIMSTVEITGKIIVLLLMVFLAMAFIKTGMNWTKKEAKLIEIDDIGKV